MVARPDIQATIDAWTYRADGQWDVVTRVGGVETARVVEDGLNPVDLFRQAAEEVKAKARKKLQRKP